MERYAMRFAIVIPTFNRTNELERCLQSIAAQTYRNFEVVIVNGGHTLTLPICNFPLRILRQHRDGLSEARNVGWVNTESDAVCFIDDDITVATGWLENIRKTFLFDTAIGGVTGSTYIPEHLRKNRDVMQFLNSTSVLTKLYKKVILEDKMYEVGYILKSGTFSPGANYLTSLSLGEVVEVDYLEACNMCFKREALLLTGGFDYAYTGTGEWSEPDLCFKVRKLGYKLVFNPQVLTTHNISQGGVYEKRTNAYERSKNFIDFYYRWRKPNWRFYCNILWINAYWVYKFWQTRKWSWLGGIVGTVRALLTVRGKV